MKIFKSHATHYIKSTKNFNFSKESYSRFKFGDSKIGENFGRDLFESFWKKYDKSLNNYKKILVFSSPYHFIPTATMSMVDSFKKLFQQKNIDYKVELRKINRTTTYSVDYGKLSAKERLNLISNDIFKINENICGDELLIFIDDIKITGSHEFVIKKMIDEYKIKNDCFFLYHAILENKKINPEFENYLNYGYVKNLSDLNTIINSNHFKINTRTVKFILNSTNEEFKNFINEKHYDFVKKLYINAKNNNYDKISDYKKNFFKLENLTLKNIIV